MYSILKAIFIFVVFHDFYETTKKANFTGGFMKNICLFLVTLSLVLLCFSCITQKTTQADLQGNWKLTKFVAENKSLTLSESNPITLTIKDTDIFGSVPYNTYNGTIAIEKDSFTFALMAVTMKSGDDPALDELERSYIMALSKTKKVSIQGKKLVLENTKEKTKMIFEAIDLKNTTWSLQGINTGNALVYEKTEATLSLLDKGELSASSGWNTLMGSYELDNKTGTVHIDAQASTRMALPSEKAQQFESRYFELLNQVESFQISGKTLNLLNKNNLVILSFIQK